MKFFKYYFLSFVLVTWAALASDTGMVMIESPKDMSDVAMDKKITIEYKAESGKNGDHLHLYVDGKRVALLRNFNGSAEVGPLGSGSHKICLEINNKMHMPTGPEGCITVNAK